MRKIGWILALLYWGLLSFAWADEYVGPDGQPLPYQSEEEIREALRTAEVVSWKKIGEGINDTIKVLLDKDGVRLHGVFRDVRVHKPRNFHSDGIVTIHFRDDCIFELAAYRLSRKLRMDNVPPVVKRKIGGRDGTLQLWIEDAVMETARRRGKVRPPINMAWRMQWNQLYIFDYLIANDDRNSGNIIYDPNWKMWLIDHTRAFRLRADPERMKAIRMCPPELYSGLKELDQAALKENLGDILTEGEIKALAQRRQELVEYLDDLIERKGAETGLALDEKAKR